MAAVLPGYCYSRVHCAPETYNTDFLVVETWGFVD
jgi:hypothetical protein